MWKKLVVMFALFLAVGGEVVLAQPAFVRELTVVAAAPGANPAAQPKHRRDSPSTSFVIVVITDKRPLPRLGSEKG